VLDRWEIIGRRLRDVRNMDVAFKFAQDVAKSVKLPGIEPVVTRIGRDTWVGFVERGRAPKILPR
jgi:hypothetical protein